MTEREKSKHRTTIIVIIISLMTLLVIYLGMVLYFTDHFYFGSEVNSISVSGKSIEETKEQMISELMAYTLNLKERGGNSEQITAGEIGLRYASDEQFKDFKDRQNPFIWVSAFFNTEDTKMTAEVAFDERLLKERVDKLSCFDSGNIIEPKNPVFKYTDRGYMIVDEVDGNKVDRDVLYRHAADAILDRAAEIDLEANDCYIKPQYTSKSQKIIEVKGMLDRYVSSKITYTIGNQERILDGSIINNWLTVDDNFEVVFNEEKEKEFIEAMAGNYYDVGRLSNFATSSGKNIDILGGDYSCRIDAAKTVKDLDEAIRMGQTVTKDLTYDQTTYVEIDLTKQHLWYYKKGMLLTQGDIVSGNMDETHATPAGIYKLKAVVKDAVLRGPGYAAPVDFWMPFNGGIGIHDATWRGTFGGDIYKHDGSHGCINCPYSLAETIFNNIAAGTPVICYY